MNVPLEPITVPLRDDGHGGLRVGNTRLRLESLLAVRAQGGTVEDLVEAFPTLELADVHAVLAWVLRHPEEVKAYRRRRSEEAAGITSPPGAFKEELLSRQAGIEFLPL
jgi:uncharacterized protein (DUF433 family)